MGLEPLKMICAWCGCLLREGKAPITHGICRRCADSMLQGMIEAEQEGRCKPKMQ